MSGSGKMEYCAVCQQCLGKGYKCVHCSKLRVIFEKESRPCRLSAGNIDINLLVKTFMPAG
jgi:hypothetical protein